MLRCSDGAPAQVESLRSELAAAQHAAAEAQAAAQKATTRRTILEAEVSDACRQAAPADIRLDCDSHEHCVVLLHCPPSHCHPLSGAEDTGESYADIHSHLGHCDIQMVSLLITCWAGGRSPEALHAFARR